MTLTIDVGRIKIVVYPDWNRVVFLFPNVGALTLTLPEAIKVMQDIKERA